MKINKAWLAQIILATCNTMFYRDNLHSTDWEGRAIKAGPASVNKLSQKGRRKRAKWAKR